MIRYYFRITPRTEIGLTHVRLLQKITRSCVIFYIKQEYGGFPAILSSFVLSSLAGYPLLPRGKKRNKILSTRAKRALGFSCHSRNVWLCFELQLPFER